MVDQKWTGTAADRSEMKTLKLEQVLKRNFGKLAIFGFASTLLCTWEALMVALSISLSNGGTAGLFWNYIITVLGLGMIYASLAELSSMIPTSGGQYFWVAVLAPRSCRRYLSFITGWLCNACWQASLAAAAYLAATLMQSLILLNNPNYGYQRWHGSLLTIALLSVAIIFNTFLAKRLPLVEGILVVCHILGIVILIPLWIYSPTRIGGSPLLEFNNPNGWMSVGVATLVGVNSPVGALIGFDCSVHMSEETKDSSKTVPYTLLIGFAANVLLGLFAILTVIYTIGPLDVALQSASGYVIIDLFYSSTKSYAATDVMTAVLILNFLATTIGTVAASSRQLWSFARNNGVPFSKFFAPDHLSYDIPLNSVLISLSISVILAVINIGSTQVLSIFLSFTASALITSYTLSIGSLIIYRLQGRPLPHSRFSLGKWGLLLNIGGLVWIIPVFFFTFFPPMPKPTTETMNWASVMYGGIVIVATAYYLVSARKKYTPPTETLEDYIHTNGNNEAEEEKSVVVATVKAKDIE